MIIVAFIYFAKNVISLNGIVEYVYRKVRERIGINYILRVAINMKTITPSRIYTFICTTYVSSILASRLSHINSIGLWSQCFQRNWSNFRSN